MGGLVGLGILSFISISVLGIIPTIIGLILFFVLF